MPLYRNINGERVEMSLEEETQTRAEWLISELREIAGNKLARIGRIRDISVSSGFMFTGSGHPAHSFVFELHEEARANIIGIATGLGLNRGLPKGESFINYWDIDNIPHAMTNSQFVLFATQARDYTAHVFQTARTHKDAILTIARDTNQTIRQRVTAINSYDVTSGWAYP